MKDIAKLAGVSEKSVSRVVNKQYGLSEKKRAEIEKIIDETGFQLNLAARGLASNRHLTVTLLFRPWSIPDYVAELQIGAMKACTDANYHLILESIETDRADDAAFIRSRIASLRTDGVILVWPYCENRLVMDLLDEREIPYVRIGPSTDKDRAPYVEIDEEQASYDIVRMLIDQGHTSIGYIPVPNDNGVLRRKGFERAMADAGLQINKHHLLPDGSRTTFPSRMPEAEDLLRRPDRPTAVACGNDQMAFWTISAAAKLGLRVPEDVSIVGFDDVPAAAGFYPPLTTLHQPIADMAKTSVQLLIEKAKFQDFVPSKETERSMRHLMPYVIVNRGTVASPPVSSTLNHRKADISSSAG